MNMEIHWAGRDDLVNSSHHTETLATLLTKRRDTTSLKATPSTRNTLPTIIRGLNGVRSV